MLTDDHCTMWPDYIYQYRYELFWLDIISTFMQDKT